MAALCRICQEQPPKYKCPTCEIPYCSLACSKKHKEDGHDVGKPISKPAEVGAESTSEAVGTADIFLSNDERFKALADSPELKELIARYPKLSDRLKDIYEQTLEPPNAGVGSSDKPYQHRGGYRGRYRSHFGGRNQGQWTPRKGDEAALRQIRRARESEQELDAQGVGAFVALIQSKCGRSEEQPALEHEMV